MIRITQLKLPITHTEEQLHRKIAKTLRLGNQPFTYEIRKQSLDARHKEDKKFVYTVDIKLDNESRILKKVHDKNIMLTAEKEYHFPTPGSETLSHRPDTVHWYWNGEKKQTNVRKPWKTSGKTASWTRIPMYSSERAVRELFPMES